MYATRPQHASFAMFQKSLGIARAARKRRGGGGLLPSGLVGDYHMGQTILIFIN